MSRILDATRRRELDRVMIMTAPRHGKSTTGSISFPGHFLGNQPRNSVITVSSTQFLAQEFGMEVRNMVRAYKFGQIFPGVSLMPDAQAKGRWRTMQGGGYMAVGVGGAIMGRGADVLLVDDPYASYEAAQSERTRNDVHNWFLNTAQNRLEPGGAIVIINHRMSADDLCGRLLHKMRDGTGDRYEVIELPVIATSNDDRMGRKIGEALWPDRYPLEALLRLKRNMNPLAWSALFMQDPAPEDGVIYKKQWFQFYDPRKPPTTMRFFMCADFAFTEIDSLGSNTPDFTEIGVFGLTPEHDLYIVDWWYGQEEITEWVVKLMEMMRKWDLYRFYSEGGMPRRVSEPVIKREMRERNIFTPLEWLPSVRDKVSRSTAFIGRMAQFKVFFPDNDNGHRIMKQMLQFPTGQFDDACDVVSLAGRALDGIPPPLREEIVAPEATPEQIAARLPTLDDMFNDALRGRDDQLLLR